MKLIYVIPGVRNGVPALRIELSEKERFNRPINPGRQTRGNLSTPPFVSIPLLPSARVNAK